MTLTNLTNLGTFAHHRWYAEWNMWDNIPAIPLDTSNILEFVAGVICQFSPRLLSTEREIGPGCIQHLRKAQNQDEFYRCRHS